MMMPKEESRMFSHKFHGRGAGKMKQEKRMKQYQEDLKTKQMKASDTPLLAMEKMREAQASTERACETRVVGTKSKPDSGSMDPPPSKRHKTCVTHN